ncbi:MAG: PAS domain S-box protein [Anaerolineae bacterium]|nr:PAS domain S-box protein [Anaerolineae bacterium]
MNDRPPFFESVPQDRNAIKIAGLYLLLGSLWILFSDQLLLLLTRDPVLLSRISLFKGWGFIIITALLLYWLIRRRNAGLRESEARYRSLFQNNHSVMLLIEPETGAIVDANLAACAFYGYTYPEITRLKITDINQLTPEQAFAEMERARQEQRRQFFFPHRLANGEVRQVEVYSGPIQFQGKTLLYSIIHDVTERKQAKQEIQSLARFPAENPNPVLRVRLDGRLLYANAASAPLLESWRCQPGERLPPDWQDHIATAAATQTRRAVEVTCGEWVYSILIAPIQSDDYVNLYGRDISEYKRTEEALRENEERLAFALEVSQMGSWEFNLTDHTAYRSLQHARIFGYQPPLPDWTFEKFLSHVIPEDRAKVERAIGQAIAAKSDWSIECRIRRCDGEMRWIWVAGRFRNHLNGDSRQIAGGIVLDITERKQADEKLRESQELFQMLFDLSPVAYSLAKLAEKIVDINPACEKLFGYPKTEIVGKRAADIDFWADPSERQKAFEKFSSEGRLDNFEFAYKTKSGAVGWAIVYANIIEQGGEKYVLSEFVDITERKRAEADLVRTMEELKRSNADLEQFAYIASHDLQEPLRAVAGAVQLLQKRYGGQLDERADEFIRHAVEGATRMQTLINDLLAYSRVGTRGQPFQPVDSTAALADALANLTVAIRESGAVITHDHLPTVVADRTQLTQLFQNLIANAIKFRGEQTPEIRIKAEQQKGQWLFAVADNGIGLEAEYYERIFGVFQRLHTRREYPGTGIGLALCKKIVERHGGRIWVESEPGRGSTFYFTLPERGSNQQ